VSGNADAEQTKEMQLASHGCVHARLPARKRQLSRGHEINLSVVRQRYLRCGTSLSSFFLFLSFSSFFSFSFFPYPYFIIIATPAPAPPPSQQ